MAARSQRASRLLSLRCEAVRSGVFDRLPRRTATNALRQAWCAAAHSPSGPGASSASFYSDATRQAKHSVRPTRSDGGGESNVYVADIWNSLLNDKDDGAPSDDVVLEYMDELRPAYETTIPQARFQKTADNLAKGFTIAQLQSYIEKRADKSLLNPKPQYNWEVRRRPWIPDVPATATENRECEGVVAGADAAQPANLLLRGYVNASMSRKQILAVQVLRVCWGLSVQEYMDAQGHMDVVVQPLQFSLLVAGAQTWLREISQSLSSTALSATANAKAKAKASRVPGRSQPRQTRHIELLLRSRTLRIMAPHYTADVILKQIHQKLQQARSLRLDLTGLHVVGDVEDDDGASADQPGEAIATLPGTQRDRSALVHMDDAIADAIANGRSPYEPRILTAMHQDTGSDPEDADKQPNQAEASPPSPSLLAEQDEKETPLWKSDLKVSQRTLDALGALTKSWVRLDGQKSILVSWIDEDSDEATAAAAASGRPVCENAAQIVYRLLVRASYDWRSAKGITNIVSVLDARFPRDPARQGRLLAELDASTLDKLTWDQRAVARWARLVAPHLVAEQDTDKHDEVQKEQKRQREPSAASLPLDLELATDEERAAQYKMRFSHMLYKDTNDWFRTRRTATVAEFGRVLHAMDGLDTQGLWNLKAVDETTAKVKVTSANDQTKLRARNPKKADDTLSLQGDRVFVPVVPPLLGFSREVNGLSPDAAMAELAKKPQVQTATTVHIHYLPAPTADLAHCAPPLEVVMDVNNIEGTGSPSLSAATTTIPPRAKLVFSELRAIHRRSVGDSLFPTQPVDVRLRQTRYYALQCTQKEQFDCRHTNVESIFLQLDKARPHLERIVAEATLRARVRARAPSPEVARAGDAGVDDGTREMLGMPGWVGGVTLPRVMLHRVGAGHWLRVRTWEEHWPVKTDYVVAGVEVRQRVATAYEGWTLALTQVDGGRSWGRQTVLTLEATPAAQLGLLVKEGPAANDGAGVEESHEKKKNDDNDDDNTKKLLFIANKSSFRQAVGSVVHSGKIQWQLQRWMVTC